MMQPSLDQGVAPYYPRVSQAATDGKSGAALQAEIEKLKDSEVGWQRTLKKDWLTYGLSDAEAEAVAKTFRLKQDEQTAIYERIKNQDWSIVQKDAIAAYKSYNYLLANQLLVADYMRQMVNKEETQANSGESR